MTWQEYYTTPVYRRLWLINRINKEIKAVAENKENSDIPDKSPHHNHPQIREMTGKFKTHVTPKTWRPT